MSIGAQLVYYLTGLRLYLISMSKDLQQKVNKPGRSVFEKVWITFLSPPLYLLSGFVLQQIPLNDFR
jgi:hypothetical protein